MPVRWNALRLRLFGTRREHAATRARRIAIILAGALPLLLPAPAALAATAASTHTADPPAAGATGSATHFTDIAGNWAEADIRALETTGVLQVPPDGLFHPNRPIDRLDFALWMARAQELALVKRAPSPAPADWSSVPAADRPYVAAAIDAGYLHGVPPGAVRPSAPLTRVQMAVTFGRILAGYGQRPNPDFLQQFSDFQTIPAWAAVAAIPVRDRLFAGEAGGSQPLFDPFGSLTRAEAAGYIVAFERYRTKTYEKAPLPVPSPPPAPAAVTPAPSSGAVSPLRVGFWYTNSNEAYQNLLTHGRQLSFLVYTGYDVQSDGKIKGYDSPRTMAWIRAHPMPFYVMFQNGWSNDSFLHDPSAQAQTVAGIVRIVQRAGYSGANLDFEGIPAADRADYTAFVARVSSALHAVGRQLSVDVPSETRNLPGSSWAGAYDYAALGPFVDNLVLMTYDYHSSETGPGPVSPLPWVRRVLAYTTSVVPASKVILGLPAYGYLWSSAGGATAYWESGMENEALKHGAFPRYDAAEGEATFTYPFDGRTYTGWFVDPQGLAAHLQAASASHVAGVLAWRMDYATPDWWPVLAQAAATSDPSAP